MKNEIRRNSMDTIRCGLGNLLELELISSEEKTEIERFISDRVYK